MSTPAIAVTVTPTGVVDVGQIVTLAAVFSLGGTATDATNTLTIRAPDGTETTQSATHGATGNYSYSLTVALAGVYVFLWAGTATVVASTSGAVMVRRQEA